MRVSDAAIRTAARRMASDGDIARMFGLTDKELEQWRDVIEQTRAASMVKARLMEIEPKYCDVIVKRWQEYTKRAATLDGRTYEQIAAERLAECPAEARQG